MTRITQVDIARKLGLSQATVTAVLNHNAKITLRSETRERVLATAHKLGYRPHRYAQIMRKGRSGLIGILQSVGTMEAAVTRAFFMAKTIHEAGYQALATDLLWYEEGLRSAGNAMLDAAVEGVLVTGISGEALLTEVKRFQTAGIPVVALGRIPLATAPQFCPDYRQATVILTRHLLRLGYRRLALLVPETAISPDRITYWSLVERVAGFRQATRAASLRTGQAEVICQTIPANADCFEPGKLGMERILARRKRPEAVLCSNDHWAVGALKACAEAGVRVPQDIALTGFDNMTHGLYTQVPLTSVTLPNEELGSQAAAMLIRLVRKERSVPPRHFVKLPCELVVRASCGASKEHAA